MSSPSRQTSKTGKDPSAKPFQICVELVRVGNTSLPPPVLVVVTVDPGEQSRVFELELTKWTKEEQTYFLTQRPDVPLAISCNIGDTRGKEVSFPALSAATEVIEWVDQPKTTKLKIKCSYGSTNEKPNFLLFHNLQLSTFQKDMNVILRREFFAKEREKAALASPTSPRAGGSRPDAEAEYLPSFQLHDFRKGFGKHEGTSGISYKCLISADFTKATCLCYEDMKKAKAEAPAKMLALIKIAQKVCARYQLKALFVTIDASDTSSSWSTFKEAHAATLLMEHVKVLKMNNTPFSKDSLPQLPVRIERLELDHVTRCSGFERAESSRAEIILQKLKKGSAVKVLSVVGPPFGPPAMSVSEIVSKFPKLSSLYFTDTQDKIVLWQFSGKSKKEYYVHKISREILQAIPRSDSKANNKQLLYLEKLEEFQETWRAKFSLKTEQGQMSGLFGLTGNLNSKQASFSKKGSKSKKGRDKGESSSDSAELPIFQGTGYGFVADVDSSGSSEEMPTMQGSGYGAVWNNSESGSSSEEVKKGKNTQQLGYGAAPDMSSSSSEEAPKKGKGKLSKSAAASGYGAAPEYSSSSSEEAPKKKKKKSASDHQKSSGSGRKSKKSDKKSLKSSRSKSKKSKTETITKSSSPGYGDAPEYSSSSEDVPRSTGYGEAPEVSSSSSEDKKPKKSGKSKSKKSTSEKSVPASGYGEAPEVDSSTSSAEEPKITERSSRRFTPRHLGLVEEEEDRDWVREFNLALGMNESPAKKLKAIARLAKDFQSVATLYGRIIISEKALPPDSPHRTIRPPTSKMGTAGGEKFFYKGILFKFALDVKPEEKMPQFLYSGTSFPDHIKAAKAAGNELRNMLCLYSFQHPELKFPLFCLVDYKGFRLSCQSIIRGIKNPGHDVDGIDENSSLIFGSCDAGKTVYQQDAHFNDIMGGIANSLNLAVHKVGRMHVDFPFCVDIEGHVVKEKYYILDTARIMPAEIDPRSEPVCHMWYNLFRPEFMMRNPAGHKISCDVFSMFQTDVDERRKLNRHALKAVQYLRKDLVSDFAEFLASHFFDIQRRGFSSDDIPFHTTALLSYMHTLGLNFRHLGRVRFELLTKHASNQASKMLSLCILTECCARACKELLNSMFVDLVETTRVPTENPFYSVLVQFLNMLLGKRHRTADTLPFWEGRDKTPSGFPTIKMVLEGKYQSILTPMENERVNVRFLISVRVFLARLMDLLGVKLTPGVLKKIAQDPNQVTFFESDIVSMEPRVKHMNLVHISNAKIALIHSTDRTLSLVGKKRLLKVAAHEFSRAWESSVFKYADLAYDLSHVYGMLGKVELLGRNSTKAQEYLEEALMWIYIGFANTKEGEKTQGEVMKRYLREIYLVGMDAPVPTKLPKLDLWMAKMIESDMVLALSSTQEGHNNGIKLVIRYLTSFLKQVELIEDCVSKLVIANLECYKAVFLTEATDPELMTEVAERYNQALEGQKLETLRDFVISSQVPVIYLSSICKCPNASSTLKKAIDFLFTPGPEGEGNSFLEFDLLQPERKTMPWASGQTWRAIWMKKKNPTPVYLYIDIDRKARVERVIKNISEAHGLGNVNYDAVRKSSKKKIELKNPKDSEHTFAPLAVFSTDLDKEHTKFFVAYPSLHKEVAVGSLMGNPLPIKATESFAWHISKAIVDLLKHYPNVHRLDPSSILISEDSQKIMLHSPVFLEEIHHLEILKGHKISLFEALLAPELRIHQQEAKISKLLLTSSGPPESEKRKQGGPTSNSILWSLGLILYNLLTGDFPYTNCQMQEKMQKLTSGPPPDLSWFRENTLLYSILSGCIVHEPRKRITPEGLENILSRHQCLTPLSISLSLSLPQHLQFSLGVLIDILEDGEWYTVQVIGAKKGLMGEEVHVNYMVEGKTEWIKLEERRRLRGFTLPYKLCSTADKMVSNWQDILEPCPKYYGIIPTTLELHDDSGVNNYYLEETPTASKETNTIQPINLSSMKQTQQSNYILL
eukprot:TRINITY_DN7457_c0_g1_i1.p1 TRINITY_DN7457_c0_g1~~TRINITY_DN7457_c0_g1_i1.p1  ORF type:complete len:1983 (+),score=482.09 TRINITY_DN7457_c0_g1_i1:12-5960(+)